MLIPQIMVIPQMEVHMALRAVIISQMVLATNLLTTKVKVKASIPIILSLVMQSLVLSITMLMAFLVPLHQRHEGFSRLYVKYVANLDI